ncbi:MAG: hypothetical protein HQL40_08255 [Alphaproteobacteria bacterium]|nr:hypothetical protein [Alphaproteobacteria bacterium]
MQTFMLAKVESLMQANQVGALAGHTATVSKVSATTNLMTLVPTDSARAAVTVKLDAARQVAEMKALIGKTLVIGKSPATIGGIGNWITLCPAGKTGAAAMAAAASDLVLLKAEGGTAAAQLPGLVGQTVTVAHPPMAAGTNAASMLYLKPAAGGGLTGLKVQGAVATHAMVGNSYVVGQGPVVGGTIGKYMVFQPVAVPAAKTIAATTVTTVAAAQPGAGGVVAGLSTSAGTLMATGAATVNPVAAASAGGTLLGTKGVCLGLGLGLGAWGPVLLGVAGVLGAASLIQYVRKRGAAPTLSDDELLAAAAGG